MEPELIILDSAHRHGVSDAAMLHAPGPNKIFEVNHYDSTLH